MLVPFTFKVDEPEFRRLLRNEHALPWRQAIIEMSGKGSILLGSDWNAKRVRHYPRTQSEVTANALVTSRSSK